MPSDEKIERVARAIYATRGAHEPPIAWRKWEDIGDEARAVWCRCATAALSAAHAEPVATEAAIRADERDATCKEGLQVEEIRQAILDHCWGDSNGNVNGSILAAEAIATAIRARGER